jgi:hypothetical protein
MKLKSPMTSSISIDGAKTKKPEGISVITQMKKETKSLA